MINFLIIEDDIDCRRTMVEGIKLAVPNASVSAVSYYESAIRKLDEAARRNQRYVGIVVDGLFPRKKKADPEELWNELAREIISRGYGREAIIVYSSYPSALEEAPKEGFIVIPKSLPDLEKRLRILARQAKQTQKK